MKKILMTLAVIASLCAFNSCGNDDDDVLGGDDPGTVGANVSGNVHVDDKSFTVRYGYYVKESDAQVMFYDIDLMKYAGAGYDDDNLPDIEMCFLGIGVDESDYEYDGYGAVIGYKVNIKRGTGNYYVSEGKEGTDDIQFSMNGNSVTAKASSLPMYKYNVMEGGEAGDNYTRTTGSFNVSGKILIMGNDARSVEIADDVVMTAVEPAQFERLKALSGLK